MTGIVILIAGKDPLTDAGGATSYVRATGRAAIQLGYEPHYFCVDSQSGIETTDFGIVHRAKSPFRPIRGLMVAAHAPFIVGCVDRFVGERKGPHLIHSFASWGGVGVAAARRLRKRGLDAVALVSPFTTYAHETRGKLRALDRSYGAATWLQHWWEIAWVRLLVHPSERRGFAGSQLVLVNYDSVRDIIRAEFGDGFRFQRITYSSEAAFLHEGQPRSPLPDGIAELEPRDAPLIVSVSRHDLRKGLAVLLNALALLRERNVPFRACLVGEGQLLAAHRALAGRLGLAGCTAVPGRAPDPYPYLEHADVFVLPSLEEGSGSMSLLEAMQAGTAAVVSRVDGLPEDVTDGENALLVPPGDPSALATALSRLLGDQALRDRLGRAARQRYLERFSSTAYAADLERIYRAVLDRSPRGAD